uniref:Uncharacterized protein n=1 Tax=Acanthochromis polyacanthus TaxID=80966 RepID=A0A3Q1FEQ5_9TELE
MSAELTKPAHLFCLSEASSRTNVRTRQNKSCFSIFSPILPICRRRVTVELQELLVWPESFDLTLTLIKTVNMAHM